MFGAYQDGRNIRNISKLEWIGQKWQESTFKCQVQCFLLLPERSVLFPEQKCFVADGVLKHVRVQTPSNRVLSSHQRLANILHFLLSGEISWSDLPRTLRRGPRKLLLLLHRRVSQCGPLPWSRGRTAHLQSGPPGRRTCPRPTPAGWRTGTRETSASSGSGPQRSITGRRERCWTWGGRRWWRGGTRSRPWVWWRRGLASYWAWGGWSNGGNALWKLSFWYNHVNLPFHFITRHTLLACWSVPSNCWGYLSPSSAAASCPVETAGRKWWEPSSWSSSSKLGHETGGSTGSYGQLLEVGMQYVVCGDDVKIIFLGMEWSLNICCCLTSF